MNEYQLEFDRRIRQFLTHLGRMQHRTFNEVKGSCFTIFEDPTDAVELTPALVEKRVLSLGADSEEAEINSFSDEAEADQPPRFIQFAFSREWFYMDIPKSTLSREEAGRIMRDRLGFFYLADRPQFTLKNEEIGDHDPFRKVYIYGDCHTAAQDMAYIFFNTWRFPVDSELLLYSAAFGSDHRWENGSSIC